MPSVSEKQHRAMEAAAHGHSTLGIPEEVGKEFVGADDSADQPQSQTTEVIETIETELDVAKAIREGQLASPQLYENIYLFDVRVTGTGTSYRKAHNEYVYRPPEHFLTKDFIERCNGLPLIFEHPSSLLNTEEYRNRAIGTVILPYIKGDEIWGIAKVFDADAAKLMMTTHASTSPAVMFRDAESTETIQIDGKTVLIEGKPSLLDHLAICEVGVWDKGSEPNGVNNNRENSMENEQGMEQAPAWFDSYTKRMDARMDALESKASERMDADEKEKEAEEKERKDSEEAKEKEAKEAAERKDSEEEDKKEKERCDSAAREAAMQAKIDSMEAKLAAVTKPHSDQDKNEICSAQMRADGTMQMFGKKAPLPFFGESPREYRTRIANELKQHSADFKAIKLDSMDEVTFKVIEDKIYSDAQRVAIDSAAATPDVLIPVVTEDFAGRRITKFSGHPNGWMRHFKTSARTCKLNINKGAA